MTEPRKPWWKRKRWIAAGVLWLVLPLLYVASGGPANYVVIRGWVTPEVASVPYRPLHPLFQRYPVLLVPMTPYLDWWKRLATRHKAAASTTETHADDTPNSQSHSGNVDTTRAFAVRGQP